LSSRKKSVSTLGSRIFEMAVWWIGLSKINKTIQNIPMEGLSEGVMQL